MSQSQSLDQDRDLRQSKITDFQNLQTREAGKRKTSTMSDENPSRSKQYKMTEFQRSNSKGEDVERGNDSHEEHQNIKDSSDEESDNDHYFKEGERDAYIADSDESNEERYERLSKLDAPEAGLDSSNITDDEEAASENVDIPPSHDKGGLTRSLSAVLPDIHLDDLPRLTKSNPRKLRKLESDSTHYVLIEESFTQWYKWDDNHVRMPCDPQNKIPVMRKGVKELRERWSIIKETLRKPIKDVFQLEESILTYNRFRSQSWKFQCLKHFFLKSSKFSGGKRYFFDMTLPAIIELALNLEVLFATSIPLLISNKNSMITMTQNQVACLLANAFLCTFPWRSKDKKNSRFPSINFSSLFNGPVDDSRLEKIKCIIHYFERVTKGNMMPDGNITYRRQVLSDSQTRPDWEKSKKRFTKLYASPEGSIENEGEGMLQVDFANKMIGGGVIGHGCVQEEIRFMICPEMIVSRLFTEVLEETEVLIMTGCERFSSYKGYSKTFVWDGNYEDKVGRDSWNRKYTEVVAMDAAMIHDKKQQFSNETVDRDLTKAYCAFMCCEEYEKLPAVCTGNWGCGAFGGDKELKALIQLIAASQAGRDVCFLTFRDKDFAEDLKFVHSKIVELEYETGDIVQRIESYYKKKEFRKTIFKAISDMWT